MLSSRKEGIMEYTILTTWDAESGVWIATSNDVPGLVLESGSLDALMERVRTAVPELLALNGSVPDQIPLYFKSERHDMVHF
jgi:predicted RNase H-like HicB family nuclease